MVEKAVRAEGVPALTHQTHTMFCSRGCLWMNVKPNVWQSHYARVLSTIPMVDVKFGRGLKALKHQHQLQGTRALSMVDHR
mmetsp:Transcript_97110/g.172909  ORF Transcript_97110/g.172909 Transcript_97110/m.172909 type:complete len:81 (-) Transcript_97110:511-753(-)